MNPRILAIFMASLSTASIVAGPASGGGFTISGVPVAGGGRSSGGGLVVNGMAGQTGASMGGGFQITGGLIGVYVVPGEVLLTLTRAANGEATLTWPAGATGYTLQSTLKLGPAADWQPVTPAPAGNTFTTPFNQPARFFRLRRP